MTKEKIYKEIEEMRLDARMKARFAVALYEKVKPLLPQGWGVSFNWTGSLSFYRWKNPGDKPGNYVAEFKLVRKLLSTATGLAFKPEAIWSDGSQLLALKAMDMLKIADGNPTYMFINITLYETSECRILVSEKVRTVKEAELLDDCLGGGR